VRVSLLPSRSLCRTLFSGGIHDAGPKGALVLVVAPVALRAHWNWIGLDLNSQASLLLSERATVATASLPLHHTTTTTTIIITATTTIAAAVVAAIITILSVSLSLSLYQSVSQSSISLNHHTHIPNSPHNYQ